MARVVVSELAKQDIRRVLSDLNNKAGYRVASNYATELKAIYRRLGDFPQSGSPRPELGKDVRIAILLPYLVFYDYRDDVVTVLRVLHGKRDITRNLLGG